MNRISAGPPTRNQVSSASDWLANSRPRNCGIVAARSATSVVTARRAAVAAPSRHLVERRELPGQRIGPWGDGAGAEEHHDVARAGEPPHHAGNVAGRIERDRLAVP